MAERPRIFLCMPRYGDISFGAGNGFFIPGNNRDLPESLQVVIPVPPASWAGSCTPHLFNAMFAQALDARDAGHVTHFAMIHSDVAPRGPWLNALWAEMQQNRLVAVSSVIAIKNNEGKSSTAVGSRSDAWKTYRWVMLDAKPSMPPTFTTADVAENDDELLLINTGLMLVDLTWTGWDDFGGFEWFTRIGRNEDGSRAPQFRPEDWEMSRFLDSKGARYGATWRVPVDHWGHCSWAS